MTTISQVVTQLVVVAGAVTLSDGFFPRVRDLNDLPISLEQGDCPQVFFHPQTNAARRLTFGAAHGARRDFVVIAYYIDTMELTPIWDSRPRTTAWCNSFVNAIDTNDDLNLTDLVASASATVKDGLRYNSVPFRGGVITISGFFFS